MQEGQVVRSGSFTIILSIKMKSSETYNVLSNGLFIFFIFGSSVFYPAEGLPEPLRVRSILIR